MSECVMNSTRIFDRRQNVNDAKAMETFLEKLNGKSVWAEIVQKAVKQCLDDADNRKEEFSRDMKALQQKFPKERICSPAAGFIMECVHVSVYKVRLQILFNEQISNYFSFSELPSFNIQGQFGGMSRDQEAFEYRQLSVLHDFPGKEGPQASEASLDGQSRIL